MVNKYYKYYPEILIFGLIFTLYVIIIVPALSWMMVNSDVGSNILAAKYFYPAHGTGEPLYVLLNHIFLYIPIGTDSWRLGLMSAMATLGGMIFVYLTIRELLKSNIRVRLFSFIAALIFGSSMLVISQTGIVQLYALVTMLSLGAYYFSLKKRWVLVAVMIGLGLAVHHLIVLTWVVLFFSYRELRNWKIIGISLLFLLFYLYQPITKYFIDAPNNWVNMSLGEYIQTNIGTGIMLIGSLSIWDFPSRMMNIFGIIIVSLGIACIPLVLWIYRSKTWKSTLLWLFILPIGYYAIDLAPDVAKYMEASIGFGAIIAVLGLSKLNIKWSYFVIVVACGLLLFNINYFDIGRTLDRRLSAQKYYDEELPKIPDNGILLTNSVWQWQETLLYNTEKKRNIVPIYFGTLLGEPYLRQLENKGVLFERNSDKDLNKRQALIAESILELNDNVWMDVTTNPATYEAIIIKGDNGLVKKLLYRDNEEIVGWEFKVSNPYDVVSGAIQINEWEYLIISNYNMRLFLGLASVGFIVNWFIFVIPRRKAKDEESEIDKIIQNT